MGQFIVDKKLATDLCSEVENHSNETTKRPIFKNSKQNQQHFFQQLYNKTTIVSGNYLIIQRSERIFKVSESDVNIPHNYGSF